MGDENTNKLPNDRNFKISRLLQRNRKFSQKPWIPYSTKICFLYKKYQISLPCSGDDSGAKMRLKLASSDGLEIGVKIEGIYVAKSATKTPVRLARNRWKTDDILASFWLSKFECFSRLHNPHQSCVTPSAILVFLLIAAACVHIVRAGTWLGNKQWFLIWKGKLFLLPLSGYISGSVIFEFF